jgi:threonine dehydratase
MTYPHSSEKPAPGLDMSLERIEEALGVIDPVFMNTPQFVDDQLSAEFGREVLVKVETANPIRSFKGRGADFAMSRIGRPDRVVCASTGNWGQAVAYAGRRRGIAVDVFVPEDINPVKLARMKAFGATVTPIGRDGTAAEEAARLYADTRPGCEFMDDGKNPNVSEGAGTIAVELLESASIDTIVIPVGGGALIAGVARWIKRYSPSTRVVGVCAKGAPCMYLSWQAKKPVSTEQTNTIAEGIDVRAPVAEESVARLVALVDDMVLVDDRDMLDGMRLAARTLGLLLEPSGAAGLAAIKVCHVPGDRVATVLTGSNLRAEQLRELAESDHINTREP